MWIAFGLCRWKFNEKICWHSTFAHIHKRTKSNLDDSFPATAAAAAATVNDHSRFRLCENKYHLYQTRIKYGIKIWPLIFVGIEWKSLMRSTLTKSGKSVPMTVGHDLIRQWQRDWKMECQCSIATSEDGSAEEGNTFIMDFPFRCECRKTKSVCRTHLSHRENNNRNRFMPSHRDRLQDSSFV